MTFFSPKRSPVSLKRNTCSFSTSPRKRFKPGTLLKDWLSHYHPTTLDELSELLSTRLKHYTTTAIQSLTGFAYLLTAAQQLNG